MVKGIIGACVGGAIGAAIWAAIVYFTGYEVGYVAVGVGVLAGFGMSVGSGDETNALTGGLAAVIAIAALLVGKYAVVNLYVNKAASGAQASMVITLDDAKCFVADQLVPEYEASGKKLTWPEGQSLETAAEQAHYPTDLWADMESRWATLTTTQQESYRIAAEQRAKDGLQAFAAVVKQEGFASSFSLWDALWFVLAIGAAYKIGAGVESGD